MHGEYKSMNQLSCYPHLSWYISNLRTIPGGQFHWGASPSEEKSGIPITMSSFRMGSTPVTWGMWKEYRQSFAVPGKKFKLHTVCDWGYPVDHPVVGAYWEEIMSTGGYCEWASKIAAFKLTLPTDAQWEYAARGGHDGLEYPWGNFFDAYNCWCQSDHLGELDKTGAVDRAYRIYRNSYGLTDMVGNVWEWCLDNYNAGYLPTGTDPVDTEPGFHGEPKYNHRVYCVRGSGWRAWNEEYRLLSYRTGYPRCRNEDIGFRLSAGSL